MDSGAQSLKTLSDNASTSLVLNLSRIHSLHKDDEEYSTRPFFEDQILNRAIIVKHRLRDDERYFLPRSQPVATKIIFPFDGRLLNAGGRSIFVGQAGFAQAMAELMGSASRAPERDFALLDFLETLPSLDPFLLKENLARKDIFPADCYFDISKADTVLMKAFVVAEMGQLIAMAFGEALSAKSPDYTQSLVEGLMSHEAGERFDPLRLSLGLEGQAFRDGLFSWKGFLYYKWQFGDIARKLSRVSSDLELVKFDDNPNTFTLDEISRKRTKLRKAIRTVARESTAVLTLYDDAFRDLIDNGKAAAFRRFLIEAPSLFLDLGSSMGTISHTVSFWSSRFPETEPLSLGSAEFSHILTEFQNSLKPEAVPQGFNQLA